MTQSTSTPTTATITPRDRSVTVGHRPAVATSWLAGHGPGHGRRVGRLTDAFLGAFEADVQAAMRTFHMPGAAVALVEDGAIVYAEGFGLRDLQRGAPATRHTRFRIASNTKSMTALLTATLVDEGVLRWDTPVVAVWPEFRAPTPQLTRGLQLRDLLGMDSGLAEPPTIEFFMSAGTASALDQLRSVAHLPVAAPPGCAYHYNNTLVSVAGYLAAIAKKAPLDHLTEAYAGLVAERVFEPIGMVAAIADDPRALGEDYAVGYSRDLFGGMSPMPFVSMAGAAPAGAAVASATDMAQYLITHLNGGVARSGRRVVSTENLTATHRPGIQVPSDTGNSLPASVLSDTVGMHYGMGWFRQTFTDGRQLLWHGGAVDGFGSQMGFFPDEGLGYVILTNLEPVHGAPFHLAVQGHLLRRLYGLNQVVPDRMVEADRIITEQREALAARTRPVDPSAAARYLGLYDGGFVVRVDDGRALRLDHDIRSIPLLGTHGGAYIATDGPGVLAAKTVTFEQGARSPVMRIDGFPPAHWLTGVS